ncbi:hypothetical protein CA284_16465 [Enterobacter mori]|nr:hypothetical protein CA284_16465 [Enterobacter mori]
MQLIEFGGTAAGSNFNDVKLPKKLNLITSSAIQVWLTRTNIDPLAGLLPAASVVNFTTEQMKLIPANCQ